MNEFWVIPTNGKWVHVKADDFVMHEDGFVHFLIGKEIIATFFMANLVGITKYKIPDEKQNGMSEEEFNKFMSSL